MEAVVLVIHLLIALALVGVVLIQRSEGGGLGMGGGTMGGMMTTRGSANLLTRTTSILAAAFFCTSLTLAVLAGNTRSSPSIFDEPATPTAPAVPSAPTTDGPLAPAPTPLSGATVPPAAGPTTAPTPATPAPAAPSPAAPPTGN